MSVRLSRTAAAALVLALGLVAVPACKKKTRPDDPDAPGNSPDPAGKAPTEPPAPAPPAHDPAANAGRDPAAPRSPVFGPVTKEISKEARDNLRRILQAFHSYEQAAGGLPGGFADRSGKVGLSWRVAILPQLGHDDLYRQFKLDEPWDGPTNKPLVSKMPAVFAPPQTPTNGYTFYRGFSGPKTWLPPAKKPAAPGQPVLGMKLQTIVVTDGAANTVLVVEAFDPVVWTKPDEFAYDPKQVPKLGGVFGSGSYFGMASTQVFFVRRDLNPDEFRKAIDPGGGGLPPRLD